MPLKITLAQPEHLGWLAKHDVHVDEAWRQRCVALQEYLLAELQGQPVGFLRFSKFWGRVPFMDMIAISPGHRRCGIGSALFAHWEQMMRRQGAQLLMTSSVADEVEPQAWHHRNGFAPAGSIRFAVFQDEAETFLIKSMAAME